MRSIFLLFLFFSVSSCQTIDTASNQGDQPKVPSDIEIDLAIDLALEHGDSTLNKVKKIIVIRKEERTAELYLLSFINKNLDDLPAQKLVRWVELHQAFSNHVPEKLFQKLIHSDRRIVQILGWAMAASFPSPAIAKTIDSELTLAITEGEEERILTPEMANAVRANKITSAYSLIREGLMRVGDDSFAKTMISLNPARSSDDFIEYLAKASIEDLRQLHQSSVNLYSCLVILRHMLAYPVSINHPQLDHLFMYAVSRNKALADLAAMVIEANLPESREQLASLLSQLPSWVQMAYIDQARRRLDPKTSLLLSELRLLTPYEDVLDELKQVL